MNIVWRTLQADVWRGYDLDAPSKDDGFVPGERAGTVVRTALEGRVGYIAERVTVVHGRKREECARLEDAMRLVEQWYRNR